MFRFENLEIWQIAVIFSDDIYDVASKFPKIELFGLSNQLRRAVVSISANIAEGSGSLSTKDFKVFLNDAIRSNAEVISELFIAKRRGYISSQEFNKLYQKGELLIKKITSFRNSL